LKFFIILSCLFFCLNSNAQNFEAVDFKNGLSQNTVLSMEQDDTGFIWLGTADGLNRFDGKSTKTFRFALDDSNCICGNEVMDIVNDNRGNLWIATSNCLNKLSLSDYTFTHYFNDTLHNQSISGNYISQIELLDNILFVVTEKGLDAINLDTESISNLIFPDNLIVKNINVIEQNLLLITTDNGLYIYDLSQGKYFDIEEHYNIQYNKLNISRSFIDDTSLFIAYQNELIKYDLQSEDSQRLFGNEYLETRDIKKWNNKIWFSTSKGIMQYDSASKIFHNAFTGDIPEGVAINSFVKSENEIWFSVGTGVLRYSIDDPLFQTIKVNESEKGLNGFNKVWHICNETNGVIISTEQGIFFLDHNGKLEPLSGKLPIKFNIQFASNVSRDEHNIWICTFDSGIYHIDLQTKKITNYSNTNEGKFYLSNNKVRHSLVLQNEVLFSTDGGLFSFDKKTRELDEVVYKPENDNGSLSKKTTFCLKDSTGQLWIGTQNGLYVGDSSNLFTYYSTKTYPSLSNNRVRNIYQYSRSLFLIGTSSGINIFDIDKKSIEYIDIKSNLQNDVIYSLEVDQDGEVWVSTNKGISLITKDRKILNFNVDDGLQGNEFNTNASAKDINGDLYFGGLYGISKFNPQKVKQLKQIDAPIITGLEILPHKEEKGFILEYPLNDFYEFTYAQCNFIVSFSSINFNNPENNNFYYKLEGFNHEWIKVNGQPDVQFMNLNQGVYDFKVRSSLRNGELSRNISSIKIKIHPPIYKSLLFKILSLIFIMILGILVFRIRVSAIKKRNTRLQEIVDVQTKKLKRANNIQQKFLNEVPEPLVIFNTKKEITFANDLYTRLIKNCKLRRYTKNGDTEQIDKTLYLNIEKMISENLNKFESELTIGERNFQLKINRIIIDDRDYGTAALLRDITSIKKAEYVLRQNEYLFRSYFEKSPIGIIYVENPEETILNCNDKFCEMVNMTKKEVLDKTMMQFTYTEDLESNIETFGNSFRNKKAYLFEPNKRLIDKNGNIVLTETHITFIYDEENKYQYMFALIHDVTEQRSNLKKLIDARTKLIQSEKLASLGQITAGVAHEINNPVNFIYNGVNNLNVLIDLLKNNKADDVVSVYNDINQMIAAIEDGAKRTAEIVKSLRLFTREDVKSVANYDIKNGIESTITLLSNKLKSGVSINSTYSHENIFINCYPGQLNQVFMNVITNAIESIENEGQIEINVALNSEYLNIYVKDTGTGISPSISSKVFEPFFSTKEPKSGTGLGLSISSSIIEKHSGQISFQDNKPKGTICIITLPLLRSNQF